MTYEPTFMYYSIEYTYPDGTKITSGAYADKTLALINVSLNKNLMAELVEVWA